MQLVKTHPFAAVTLLIGLVFVLAQLGLPIKTFPDSGRYLWLLEGRGMDGGWQAVAANRPFLVQLWFWALGTGPLLLVAQALLSFASWLMLAVQAQAVVGARKLLVFALILSGCLGANVLQWNGAVLSESLSISLMVLLFACVLWAVRTGLWRAQFMLVGVALLWGFTRDSAVYAVAVLAVLWPMVRLNKQHMVTAVLVLLTVLPAQYFASVGVREYKPLRNSLYQRILPDEGHRAFFVAQGFPESAAVQACAGKWVHECNLPNEAEAWLSANGKRTYMLWLLHGLPLRTWEMLGDGREVFLSRMSSYMGPDKSWRVQAVAWLSPLQWLGGAGTLLGAAVLAGVVVLKRRSALDQIAATVPRALLALGGAMLAFLFVSYWGDAMEIARHCLLPVLGLGLVLWLLALFLFTKVNGTDRP
jgi:hypothetical protein